MQRDTRKREEGNREDYVWNDGINAEHNYECKIIPNEQLCQLVSIKVSVLTLLEQTIEKYCCSFTNIDMNISFAPLLLVIVIAIHYSTHKQL